MKYLKQLAITLLMTLGLVLPVASLAHAQSPPLIDCTVPDAALCQEIGKNGAQDPKHNSLYGPNGILTKVTAMLANVIGIVAVIMIIVGGLKYVLSQGDSNNVNSAKNTILYAIIGVVIAVMARAIVIFVLNKI